MDIIMIFAAIVVAVLATLLITATFMHLTHTQSTRRMMDDAKVALAKQALESYRSGYMRGMVDEKIRIYDEVQDRTIAMTLISH
jgi:hypothetical protein